MSEYIQLQAENEADGIATVTLNRPDKYNALSRQMWRELQDVFTRLQAESERWRCIVLRGAGGHFGAGGDIAEYPEFRFEESTLRDFHEAQVWGGLQAVLDCDVPVIAAIDGHCLGAGLELACCADVRVATPEAKFGAPIARLGFPMAPRELALIARVAGEATAREMLLTAAVLRAPALHARGFLHALCPAHELPAQALALAHRAAALSPMAARHNKQTLRALARSAMQVSDDMARNAYRWASHAEHIEGITAFLEKRPPRF